MNLSTFVLSCLVVVLVTFSTSDESLLNYGKTNLLIVNVPVPFVWFLGVTPFVLVGWVNVFYLIGQWPPQLPELEKKLRVLSVLDTHQGALRILSMVVRGFLSYWLVPIVSGVLIWKALPHPKAHIIISGPSVSIGVFLFLQIGDIFTIETRRNLLCCLGLAGIILFVTLRGYIPVRKLNLFEANLEGLDLRSFSLRGADMARAKLAGAILDQVDLRDADLRSANLSKVSLIKAALTGVNAIGTDFSDATLADAYFNDAAMREAKLQGANLFHTRFERADLRWADLKKTTVSVITTFQMANLQSADLREVGGLSQAHIDRACADRTTKLPDGLKAPDKVSEECAAYWQSRRPAPRLFRIP